MIGSSGTGVSGICEATECVSAPAWRRRGWPNLLDPDYLARLAESTEARFGKEG